MKTKTLLTLKTRTYAVGIHGISGRATEEGWLDAGTPIRNVRETGAVHPLDGMPWYRLDASTDGGRTWFTQEVCGEPKTV
jgi:hypothetical protein